MRRRLLQLSALLLAVFSASGAFASPQNETQRRELCGGFSVICAFVSSHCEASGGEVLDAKCAESFQLFYEHGPTLSACEAVAAVQAQDRGDDVGDQVDELEVANARKFLIEYAAWQAQHACELFHRTEAKAAHACSGPNVHKPWHEDAWPLFCKNVFATYATARHEIDRLCERTRHSDAFWEGFAEFSAEGDCKQYYRFVRAAASDECDRNEMEESCVQLFEWYTEHQQNVERDCLELRASRSFYRGFYKWKKQQH